MFQTKFREKIRTHIFMFNNFFPPENHAAYEIMSISILELRQITDDNMAHAHCVLDTYGSRHAPCICNTCCFRAATIVERTRLSVTL